MKKAILCGIACMGTFLNLSSASGQSVPVMEVHARRYTFVPSEVTIRKGQTVKLELVSDDVIHSLVIDGLHLQARMPARKKVEVVITPNQVGDFKGKCGVFCGSGHGQMTFTVHVVSGDKAK
jgi:cytochrome c oxidase subunit 2